MAEHVLILSLTSSQNNKLHRILAHFFHHIGDQVEALLIRQTGDDSDHHGLRIYFQTQLLLKPCLVFHFLFSEILCIKRFINMWIRFRIVIVVVQSVYDTAQVIGARPEKTIQSFSVKRSLDFLCVGIAYRCDRVRIYQSTFQIVCVFLEFKLVRSKEIIGQPCAILNRFPIPDSLEF